MPQKRKKINASGIMDIIKNPIGYINDITSNVANRLNNISRSTLEKYGNIPIGHRIQIIRSPLRKFFTTAMNVLSLGAVGELQDKYQINKFYHLSLLVQVNNQHIIIEKNEVVNIAPIELSNLPKDAEFYNIHFNKVLTLNEMIDNTIKFMGDSKFYGYSGMATQTGKKNNCQDYINALLSSNSLLTPQAHKFLYQNIEQMNEELNKLDGGFTTKAMQFVTDSASKISRLIGKGKGKIEFHPKFIKMIKNNKFQFI